MNVEEGKIPSLAKGRLAGWGVPASLWGYRLSGSVPDSVYYWNLHAVSGDVFRPGNDSSGAGLVVIGSLKDADASIAAIIQDYLRHPLVKQDTPVLPPGWMRWETASSLHRSLRNDSEGMEFWSTRLLLVITPVVAYEYWALSTVAEISIRRARAALPTFLSISKEDYRAVMSGSEASFSPLRQAIEYSMMLVSV
mgnify:FL=1